MEKVILKIETIHKAVSIIFLVIFVLSIILQVLTRYVSFISIYWTEEVARYSFIWAIFMGSAIMVRQNGHFAMDFLIEKLSVLKVKWINIFNQFLISVFGFLMLYYGYLLVQNFWGWTFNTIPIINQQFAWAAVPISGFMIIIYSLYNIFDILRN